MWSYQNFDLAPSSGQNFFQNFRFFVHLGMISTPNGLYESYRTINEYEMVISNLLTQLQAILKKKLKIFAKIGDFLMTQHFSKGCNT